MGAITHPGDAVTWAREYSGQLFHALLCDAPYEMAFMGKDWDGSGVAFDPDTWEAFARVLYPGAFLFVFAGTINDDLISVAMREAGLRKFHKMMGWAYGSGFPKASRVDANIEKRRNDEIRHVCRFLRAKMEEAGKSSKEIAEIFGFNSRMVDHWAARETDSQPLIPTWEQWKRLKVILSFNGDMDSEVKRLNKRKGTYGEDWQKREIVGKLDSRRPSLHTNSIGLGSVKNQYDITLPATPLAQAFAGHRYGLQALKPAIETILIFQKPYEGKPLDNITQTGAGVLNIDGGRIEGSVDSGWNKTKGSGDKFIGNTYNSGEAYPESRDHFDPDPSGRWPSNFLLLDEAAARALDEQSGITRSDGGTNPTTQSIGGRGAYKGGDNRGFFNYQDSGGASRFFFQVSEQIDEADPVFYSAKASRGERDAGLEGFETSDSVVQNTSGRRFNPICDRTKKRIQDCKCGSCEWSQSTNPKVRNPHPTVKPLSLTRYLATLLLPPVEYAPRRLFVPFAGVGSEQIGGVMAGWEHVEGVELTEEYIPINRARIKYWSGKDISGKKPKSKIPENVKNPNQMELI